MSHEIEPPEAWESPPEDVIERAFAGEERARELLWGWVLVKVTKLAHAIGRRYGLSRQDIEDIIQNTIMCIFKKPAAEIAGVEHWNSWLWAIVRARCIDKIRELARHRGCSPLDLVGEDPEDENAGLRDFFVSCYQTDAHASLNEVWEFIIRELGKKRRGKERARVFRLYVMGYTQEEIAQETGWPQTTVNNWVDRTRKKVREKFCPTKKEHETHDAK